MIEVRHLKLIEAINRLGSLKKAAGELFLTQSALSHQLKQLETTVGTPIFIEPIINYILRLSAKLFLNLLWKS